MIWECRCPRLKKAREEAAKNKAEAKEKAAKEGARKEAEERRGQKTCPEWRLLGMVPAKPMRKHH